MASGAFVWMLAVCVWAGAGMYVVVASPAVQSAGQRVNRALVIGVGQYPKYPNVERLRYASADGAAFSGLVSTEALGRFSEQIVLREEQATLQAVRAALSKTGAPGAGRLVFFFAGHGVLSSRGQIFLMPWDGDPADPEHTGVSADEINAMLAGAQPTEAILFVDACNSGSIGLALSDALVGAGRTGLSRMVGLFSSAHNAPSYEHPLAQAGVFSYFLVDGLRGLADKQGNADGIVTAEELAVYVETGVSRRVSQAFGVEGLRQQPARSAVFDRDTVLAVLPKPASRPTSTAPPQAPRWLHVPTFTDLTIQVAGVQNPAGIDVQLTDLSDDTKHRATVGRDGRALLQGLSPGPYSVWLGRNGTELYRGSLTVPAQQGASVLTIDVTK
jgi:hypothetical protein